MTDRTLGAVAFLTNDKRFVNDSDNLLGPWLHNFVPREWGTGLFSGTGRKLPALIALGSSRSEGTVSYSDLTASHSIRKLEQFTGKPLSEFTIECKECMFAGESVWLIGFFEP